jgi:hypothetical protein
MKHFLNLLPLCFILLLSCKSSNQKTEGGDSLAVMKDTLVLSENHSNANPDPSAPRVEMKGVSVWEGTINNKTEMVLTLTFDNDVVYGKVVYKKSGIPIMVIGYRDSQNNFRLQEYYHSNAITGIYSGLISSVGLISGDWYGGKDNYEKALDFKIKRKEIISESVPEFKEEITGAYGYKFNGDNGAMGDLLAGVKGDSVIFSFLCVTPGPAFNIANMMDTSKLEKNHTKYKNKDENGLCEFDIFFVPGGAVIQHANGGYQCGFGLNASVDGIYFKEDNKQPDFEKMARDLYGR